MIELVCMLGVRQHQRESGWNLCKDRFVENVNKNRGEIRIENTPAGHLVEYCGDSSVNTILNAFA
jgi:hypothetical protein